MASSTRRVTVTRALLARFAPQCARKQCGKKFELGEEVIRTSSRHHSLGKWYCPACFQTGRGDVIPVKRYHWKAKALTAPFPGTTQSTTLQAE